MARAAAVSCGALCSVMTLPADFCRSTSPSTKARSTTAMRPQRKAARLMSTATPDWRMASSIDSACSGIVPAWKATPTMKLLVAIASPNSPSASAWPSRKTLCSLRVTRSMPAVSPLVAGNNTLRLVTICPVGVWVVDTTAIVRSGLHLSRFFGSVALRMSKPR